jgi:hypothetical protein
VRLGEQLLLSCLTGPAAGASHLELEIKRLTNAVLHLLTSNIQLKEALLEEHDQELKDAFNENLVTIARYNARIAAMEEELCRMKGTAPDAVAAYQYCPKQGDAHMTDSTGAPSAAGEGVWL